MIITTTTSVTATIRWWAKISLLHNGCCQLFYVISELCLYVSLWCRDGGGRVIPVTTHLPFVCMWSIVSAAGLRLNQHQYWHHSYVPPPTPISLCSHPIRDGGTTTKPVDKDHNNDVQIEDDDHHRYDDNDDVCISFSSPYATTSIDLLWLYFLLLFVVQPNQ